MRLWNLFFSLIVTACLLPGLAIAQAGIHPEVGNYRYFSVTKKKVTAELEKLTGKALQQHPEYGTVPYKAVCTNCSEILDKRDAYSRYFISDTDSKEFYVQQSYFPLHYKDVQGRWITADPRLRPMTKKGLYMADRQPVQTFYDDEEKASGIVVDGMEFRYNQHLSMYYLDEGMHKHDIKKINRRATTEGDDGVYTTEAWSSIDMEQAFMPGGIETNFLIKRKLDLPAGNGWVVFEDQFTLPAGCKLEEDDHDGHSLGGGNWQGSYKVVNSKGRMIASIQRPRYFDSNRFGTHGVFQLKTEGDTYTLSVMVPAAWLNSPGLKYPLFIDPWVSGFDSLGFYLPPSALNSLGAKMAFSSFGLGCPYDLTVNVPGHCTLQNAYLQIEYALTDSICDYTPGANPYCRYQDVVQTLVGPCDTLGISCDTTHGAYAGECTTDSILVPIAGAVFIGVGANNGTNGFVSCVPPQCDSFHILYTLYNRSNNCADSCSYNCAEGSYFALTICGRLIEDTATVLVVGNKGGIDTICAGSPVTLVALPAWGVPPYTYKWYQATTNQPIFVGSDSMQVANPDPQPTTPASDTEYEYISVVYDQCGDSASGVTLVVTKPSPPANAGKDTSFCKGGQTTLGGNPTGPAGDSFSWTAVPPYASAWLSSTSIANPVVAPPIDSIGTYSFVVTVNDPVLQCFRTDTVTIVLDSTPKATIQPDPAQVCQGQSVTLSTTIPYAAYQWSTGAATPTVSVKTAGPVTVNVTDSFGCKGGSDTATVSVVMPLAFTVSASPDSVINVNDNTTLGASIDLQSSDVQTYIWSPKVNISCTDCPQPVVSPTSGQEYILTVTDTNGCQSKDSILIIVNYPDRYWIASAFTPNNDGLNDQFYIIKESGVTVNDFRVYNRWGQLVHQGLTPWDGTLNGGEKCPIDVYVYYFSLEFSDGRKTVAKGNVTLIR